MAEYWDLRKSTKTVFDHIKRAEILTESHMFLLLDQNKVLKKYDEQGQLLGQVDRVENVLTDGRKNVFVQRKTGNRVEIVDMGGDENVNKVKEGAVEGTLPWDDGQKVLYSTESIIERLELSLSEKWIFVTEKSTDVKKRVLVFVDRENGELRYPLGKAMIEEDFFNVTEIQNGEQYLIEAQKHYSKEGMVELWYGNDGNLKDMEYGALKSTYVVWVTDRNMSKNIPTDRFFFRFFSEK